MPDPDLEISWGEGGGERGEGGERSPLQIFSALRASFWSQNVSATCVCNHLSERPLNTENRRMRILWHVPLVLSVLTGFYCTNLKHIKWKPSYDQKTN